MPLDALRRRMLDLIDARAPATDLKSSSLATGKNHAYLHQFVYRGSPRRLPEEVRYRLAAHLGVDESLLRDDDPRTLKPLSPRSAPAPALAVTAPRLGAPPGRAERLARAQQLVASVTQSGAITAVPEMAISAAAGGGAFIDTEHADAHWYFPTEWLLTELRARTGDLRIIAIVGDSMEPLLMPGDKVLVDLSKRSPTPPGVFILFDGLGLVAKQIEHMPNTAPPRLAITSANTRYQHYERTIDEINIIGRVVWFGRRM
ncbi:MAG: S24 family peptidase [Alphaproteobacteria bacterium]|nr:S24 family peptidase [Alphaproteobacteria bacterium]